MLGLGLREHEVCHTGPCSGRYSVPSFRVQLSTKFDAGSTGATLRQVDVLDISSGSRDADGTYGTCFCFREKKGSTSKDSPDLPGSPYGS